MAELTATEARDQLPDALNRVAFGGERIQIKRRGKVLAALISREDLELLELIEDKYYAKLAEEALEEAKRNGEEPIPLEDVMKELGIE